MVQIGCADDLSGVLIVRAKLLANIGIRFLPDAEYINVPFIVLV